MATPLTSGSGLQRPNPEGGGETDNATESGGGSEKQVYHPNHGEYGDVINDKRHFILRQLDNMKKVHLQKVDLFYA